MNKVVVCVAAGVVSSAVFASDWYVDANNGNDAWMYGAVALWA